MSALFGYVLRRAEQRFRLDAVLHRGHDPEGRPGQPDDAGDGLLLRYIDEAIGPGRFQNAMIFEETHVALQVRVNALFGDLRDLRFEFVAHDSWQEAVRRGELPSVKLARGDLRRLLLESVAFGCLLREAEQQADQRFTLTPASRTGLDDFGMLTDANGDPTLPT